MWRVAKYFLSNTTVVNALVAADIYGYHRVYRRVLEILKQHDSLTPSQKKLVCRNLKAAIRMPTTAYQHLTESHTAEFLVKLAEDVADRTHLHMPPSVVAVAEMLFRRTPMGRFVDILKRAADKKEHERRKKVES